MHEWKSLVALRQFDATNHIVPTFPARSKPEFLADSKKGTCTERVRAISEPPDRATAPKIANYLKALVYKTHRRGGPRIPLSRVLRHRDRTMWLGRSVFIPPSSNSVEVHAVSEPMDKITLLRNDYRHCLKTCLAKFETLTP